MNTKRLYLITGVSYLGIFVTAIFANFLVLDSLKENPVEMATDSMTLVSLGAVGFMIAGVLDTIVAWTLKQLFEKHPLTTPSTYFRLIHAVVMSLAVFALVMIRGLSGAESILYQVAIFDTLWLIGLFFFGVHLMMLSRILSQVVPRWLAIALFVAGAMYMVDTTAQFVLTNYDAYADIFLTLVAIPSIVGEMSLAVWMLRKSRR